MSARSDELAEVEAFRPSAKPLVFAVLANVVLAALCLGVPYFIGKREGEASLRAFADFSGCLFGAEPRTGLGLSLPPGERAHFAAQVLASDPKWPARCREPLRRIAPADAVFRWPSFKTAAADVRAVTALLDQDLAQLARSRSVARARAPERPLLIVGKLRAALTLLARATSMSEGIDADAVRFDPKRKTSRGALEPSRLPLVTSERAALTLVTTPAGLDALGLDGRGLSWLSQQGAQIDRKRVKRTSLVRGVLREGDRWHVLWAMPEARCAEQADRCARRALGVAELDTDADELPPPIWLTAHPAARFDRSVRLLDGAIEVLARTPPVDGQSGPGIELRRFARLEARGAAEDAAPEPPLEHSSLEAQALLDTLLLEDGHVAIAERSEGTTRVRVLGPEAESIEVGTLDGDSAFLAGCKDMLAYGNPEQVALARRMTEPDRFEPLTSMALAIGAPFDAEDPARDRVRLLCDDRHALLLALSEDQELHAVLCERERDRDHCTQGVLGTEVATFDAALTQARIVIASSTDTDPTIVVGTFERTAGVPKQLSSQAVAACWDPPAGMCGRPTLASAGKRVLLAAREGSDLLVLESLDEGTHFTALESLRGDAPTGSSSQPMDQHRLRKGLER